MRSNKSKVRISSTAVTSSTVEKSPVKKTKSIKQVTGKTCPKCNKGTLLKGSKAFGCSDYNKTCDFLMPFEFLGKKISENQLIRLIDKYCTTNLKGFKTKNSKVEGLIRFDENYKFKFEPKKTVTSSTFEKSSQSETITCPKCKKGTVLKGKTAYGCSEHKSGCDFLFTFEKIKKIANGKPLTKELVLKIISA